MNLSSYSAIDLLPKLVEALPNGFSFEMIRVKGGVFAMGSEDSDAYDWEKPVHQVKLDGFCIGKYPATQALWKAVMGEENNPSFFQGNKRPVDSVSWEDTQVFIKKLNELTGKGYRLLTEAEWEYAARGGNRSRGYKYAGGNKLKEVGWYEENSHGETKAVGQKKPNELGLYDMSGNVREWVEDHWNADYQGAPADGSAWVDREQGVARVFRGGGWNSYAWNCRVSSRHSTFPPYRNFTVGFRLGLSLQPAG